MKNKGFTIIELLLVIVLMGVISAIIIPSILDSLDASKTEKYNSIQKLVVKNLKFYNEKNESDLWNGVTENCIAIPFVEIQTLSGSEINIDDCDANSVKLYVFKSGDNYSYYATLSCNNGEYEHGAPSGVESCRGYVSE